MLIMMIGSKMLEPATGEDVFVAAYIDIWVGKWGIYFQEMVMSTRKVDEL